MSDIRKPTTKRSTKDDQQRLLSEKLLEVLTAQRVAGGAEYPLSLRRLAQLAGERASDSKVKAAVTNSPFAETGFIVKPQKKTKAGQLPAAPVCLLEDLPRLAESDLVLDYCFELACSGKTRVFTPSNLESELSTSKGFGKLFRKALDRRLAEGTLPPTVGCLPYRATRYLFRLADVQTTAPAAAAFGLAGQAADSALAEAESAGATAVFPPPKHVPPPEFAELFEATFDRLDLESGSHNFLKLYTLRRALPQFERTEFDAGLRALRLAGRYVLDSSDGNVVSLSAEERQAGIREAGSLLVYCSRR